MNQDWVSLPLVVGLLCSAAMPARADLGVTEIPIVDAPSGTAGLGFGIRAGTSPYVGIDNVSSMENDNDTDLVPLYLYEGKVLFSHGTSAGVHVVNTDRFGVDLLAKYRFDRLESDADIFFAGLDDREQTIDGGLSFSLKGTWGKLSATWVADLLDNHNGSEVDLTYRVTRHPGRWSLSPFISYVHQDQDLTNYYYGVSNQEATLGRPAYRTDSAEFWRAGINSSYQWSRHMLLFANVAFESVPDTVVDSPLVDEDHLSSAMVGLAYMFGNVLDGSAVKKRPERKGEWSWRVNAGYTADETFHKVHRGYVKRSGDVHAYLGGLTLGKLLQDGRRVDYWGRFSLNRRFENDLQDDFWEYNAYVMVMGTGYSPWTDKELFRYGLGFGFSYAERVPMVEQIKQASRGENTSHFLNYLEAQIDFPLNRLFGDAVSNKCYVGLTLVHRSGIFANSDILGNVSGGSDVLTAHLECKR
ncbi:MAG: MipA/OmpV family protein [Gammaproteobacteria bacterium]|nr:MipA/OmpV family protein [Gammaproteobacteria bacterium]